MGGRHGRTDHLTCAFATARESSEDLAGSGCPAKTSAEGQLYLRCDKCSAQSRASIMDVSSAAREPVDQPCGGGAKRRWKSVVHALHLMVPCTDCGCADHQVLAAGERGPATPVARRGWRYPPPRCSNRSESLHRCVRKQRSEAGRTKSFRPHCC